MTITLDKATIECIGLFQGITTAAVRDCILEPTRAVYVVEEGQIGSAIGRDGANIHAVRSRVGKSVKVYEYSPDPKRFIVNLLDGVEPYEITIKNNTAYITISAEDKGRVVGKDGKNIKSLTKILERQHNISSITVKTKTEI
ncbi:MAG: NusA-like transcription termination signal-binding factor [archaeon]